MKGANWKKKKQNRKRNVDAVGIAGVMVVYAAYLPTTRFSVRLLLVGCSTVWPLPLRPTIKRERFRCISIWIRSSQWLITHNTRSRCSFLQLFSVSSIKYDIPRRLDHFRGTPRRNVPDPDSRSRKEHNTKKRVDDTRQESFLGCVCYRPCFLKHAIGTGKTITLFSL